MMANRTLPQPPDTDSASGPLIYLVAGERSGDNLGAQLMAALDRKTGGRARFAGIGGPAMEKCGLKSLFPISELSLMGIAEIIPHLPNLFRRMRQTADDIAARKPDIVITIDAPDFCLRLAKRIRPIGIPLVHYVAPQIWAWRPGRGKKLAKFVDYIMAILPFEPEFFAQFDVPCTYVGHPILDSGSGKGDAVAFRARHGISDDKTLIAVLPGSRRGEIGRILPIYADVLAILARQRSDLVAVVSTLDTVADDVTAAMVNWPVPAILVTTDGDKHDGFAACRAALAKSGTVNLELMLAGVPMAICYRVNALTAFIAKRLVTVSHASLVNLMAGSEVAPEFIQDKFKPEPVADAIAALLDDGPVRQKQIDDLAMVKGLMADLPAGPSDMAADVVLDMMAKQES